MCQSDYTVAVRIPLFCFLRPRVITLCSRDRPVALNHLTFLVGLRTVRGEANSVVLSEGTG